MTEKTETPEEVESKEAQNLESVLKNFGGSPSPEKLEAWKSEHGEIYCSGFSSEELFVWRPISRAEFVDMQARAQEESFDSENVTVNTCILWASEPAKQSLVTKAGSLTTLHEQIMQNSNFMPPAMAAQLVIKL